MPGRFDVCFDVAPCDAERVQALFKEQQYHSEGTFDDHGVSDHGPGQMSSALFGWYDVCGYYSPLLRAVRDAGIPFVARLWDRECETAAAHQMCVPAAEGEGDSDGFQWSYCDEDWNVMVPLALDADPARIELPEDAAAFLDQVRAMWRAADARQREADATQGGAR